MEWWDRITHSVRRVWLGIAARLRFRKTGLVRLKQEVSTCEYEDVHVMWEMLRRTNARITRYRPPPPLPPPPPKKQKRHAWAIFNWARRAPYHLCRGF